MRAYDAFFFGAFFFLLGILAASVEVVVGWWVTGGIVISLVLWRARGRRWLAMAALLLFIPVGALYYVADDARFHREALPVGEGTFHAEVISLPQTKDGTQEAVLKLKENDLRVLAKLPAYPALTYGDTLTFTGRVEEPFSDTYRTYLAKERVRGVVAFPDILVRNGADSVSVRGALYALRGKIVDSFRRTLPAKEAALMAGITVGAREDFSESFRTAMAESGTTHLVALSGYNISVVVQYAMLLFLLFLSRRTAFAATLAVILAFVLMTGAEASVVRAAVMGGIGLLARHMGRRFDVRNAILFAAVAMVLINPKVLAFDLGFQLSFLALLGIVYLKPAFDSFLGWKSKPSLLSWRENLTTTASAQLAVAPLLIHTFGSVSLTSLAANVVVLEVVPFTMGLGFVLAGVSFLSLFLAKVLALLALVLLKFQTLMIELFATLALPVGAVFSAVTAVFYYGALFIFIWYVNTHLVSRRI